MIIYCYWCRCTHIALTCMFAMFP